MAGLDDELTDEQLAAQDFTENATHVLTIWHWSVNISRREYLASLLLGICDRSNGSVELCMSFCQSMDICIQNSVRRI